MVSIPSCQIDIPELIPRNRMNFRTLEKLLQKILPSVVGANPCTVPSCSGTLFLVRYHFYPHSSSTGTTMISNFPSFKL